MTSEGQFDHFLWGFKTEYPPLVKQYTISEEMVHWPGLLGIASVVRGVGCRLGSINFGGCNMVRQVIFEDGVKWVARVPMPRRIVGNDGVWTVESKDEYWTEERAKEMQSQIYTVMYIREHSEIPVPEIFAFDITKNNSFGAPYILMECVMGNCIMDISRQIPKQYEEKVHVAIAKFQFQLSTIHFNQIGRINKDINGGYCIEAIPGIGGPFSLAADYYRAWATYQRENPRAAGLSEFPNCVSRAAEFLSSKPSGPFTLSHPDFGYHNFLVDDHYNLLAVVDWDEAFVGPIEFSAVFPMSLSTLHPSMWQGSSFDTEERRQEEAVLAVQQAQYRRVLDAEAERTEATPMVDSLSLQVLIAQGINRYPQGDLNPWEWLVGFLERDIFR